jgi:hypothetical protein
MRPVVYTVARYSSFLRTVNRLTSEPIWDRLICQMKQENPFGSAIMDSAQDIAMMIPVARLGCTS